MYWRERRGSIWEEALVSGIRLPPCDQGVSVAAVYIYTTMSLTNLQVHDPGWRLHRW